MATVRLTLLLLLLLLIVRGRGRRHLREEEKRFLPVPTPKTLYSLGPKGFSVAQPRPIACLVTLWSHKEQWCLGLRSFGESGGSLAGDPPSPLGWCLLTGPVEPSGWMLRSEPANTLTPASIFDCLPSEEALVLGIPRDRGPTALAPVLPEVLAP